MSLSVYDASIGVFLPMLGNAALVLGKAETFADERGMAHPDILGLRLAPDMLPLDLQIRIAVDGARGAATRLARLPLPDPEAAEFAVFNRGDELAFGARARTLGELIATVEAGQAYLRSVPRAAVDEPDEGPVVAQMGGTMRIFERQAFLLRYALPNFYFHLSIAYALLRQVGVGLGKADFEGPPVYRRASAPAVSGG